MPSDYLFYSADHKQFEGRIFVFFSPQDLTEGDPNPMWDLYNPDPFPFPFSILVGTRPAQPPKLPPGPVLRNVKGGSTGLALLAGVGRAHLMSTMQVGCTVSHQLTYCGYVPRFCSRPGVQEFTTAQLSHPAWRVPSSWTLVPKVHQEENQSLPGSVSCLDVYLLASLDCGLLEGRN